MTAPDHAAVVREFVLQYGNADDWRIAQVLDALAALEAERDEDEGYPGIAHDFNECKRELEAEKAMRRECADSFAEVEAAATQALARAEAAERRLAQADQALDDACDVAIWLSALIGNPDGAADPIAAETWEETMRPKLHAALAARPAADTKAET